MKKNLLELKRRITALSLALTMSAGLYGCSERSDKAPLLEETFLDETFLVNIDGEINLVCAYEHGEEGTRDLHYENVITGNTYIQEDDYDDCEKYTINFDTLPAESITYIGEIAKYMTEEEIVAASGDALTDEMIASIIYRVLNLDLDEMTLKRVPENQN